jgi:hypothetical protein
MLATAASASVRWPPPGWRWWRSRGICGRTQAPASTRRSDEPHLESSGSCWVRRAAGAIRRSFTGEGVRWSCSPRPVHGPSFDRRAPPASLLQRAPTFLSRSPASNRRSSGRSGYSRSGVASDRGSFDEQGAAGGSIATGFARGIAMRNGFLERLSRHGQTIRYLSKLLDSTGATGLPWRTLGPLHRRPRMVHLPQIGNRHG